MAQCEFCGKPPIGETKHCVRCSMLQVVLKQACALGLPWRKVCAPLMAAQKVTVSDVEAQMRLHVDRCTLEIGSDGKSVESYKKRGILYCQLDEFDRAWDDAEAAMAIDDREPYVYLIRSVVYSSRKQFHQAVEECNKAIAIDPSLEYAKILKQGASEAQQSSLS